MSTDRPTPTPWVPEGAIDAMQILVADGYPADKAGTLVAAMLKNGQDPVATARHFVKLRQAVRL